MHISKSEISPSNIIQVRFIAANQFYCDNILQQFLFTIKCVDIIMHAILYHLYNVMVAEIYVIYCKSCPTWWTGMPKQRSNIRAEKLNPHWSVVFGVAIFPCIPQIKNADFPAEKILFTACCKKKQL